jgi:hypothetical protein
MPRYFQKKDEKYRLVDTSTITNSTEMFTEGIGVSGSDEYPLSIYEVCWALYL